MSDSDVPKGKEQQESNDTEVVLEKTELSTVEEVVEVISDASDEPTVQAPAVEEPVKKSNKGLLFLVIFLFLFILVGVGAAGYYGWTTKQSMDEKISVLSQQTLAAQQAAQSVKSAESDQNASARNQLKLQIESQINNNNKAARSQLSKQQQSVDMLQKRVDGHQQRLLSLSTTSREDWMLAEAEYLLKLANQRVLLERTSENAVALLASADALVGQVSAGTGDAELFAIRKAISRDLAALKLIEPIDKDGIYLELQALAELIDQLPRVPKPQYLIPFNNQSEPVERSVTDEAEIKPSLSARFLSELGAMAGTLNQYIKMEDSTAPAKPLVDQHFTQVAGLNVRLLLEQAQIALLKESPVIYSNSLTKANELIAKYYIVSAPATEFQKTISTLADINIAPELPDISQSLKLLHGYIQQLHKLQVVDEGQL